MTPVERWCASKFDGTTISTPIYKVIGVRDVSIKGSTEVGPITIVLRLTNIEVEGLSYTKDKVVVNSMTPSARWLCFFKVVDDISHREDAELNSVVVACKCAVEP